ncbi:DUF4259 domain-containing protein [Crocosphaera sp. XPORK-15E]|uniref:DUF4259 domain-containing protein n=1 Tax=Crocosphaera sp. XPORK-15E TaxID=3110247 RepID=UPI002B21C2FD|nr:DUF4259 domain-containing protein [Crocosphaera sp. XPORK-15E]MEA5536064.1 DUF4259 domain-containing protein [Crocosphaera sp. XPORK-15E]
MGVWGYEAFENDYALDWVSELENNEDVVFIIKQFERILNCNQDDYLDIFEASITIAAAEVVAALLGNPSPDLPQEVIIWLTKKRQKQLSPTVVEKASNAVQRVLNNSELREVWQESDEYDTWSNSVNNLLARLG